MRRSNTPIEKKLHTNMLRYSNGSPVFGVESFTCAAVPVPLALPPVLTAGVVVGCVPVGCVTVGSC